VPDLDSDYLLRPQHDAGDPGRLRLEPPRHGHRLSRHRQVDAYRAGGARLNWPLVRVNLDSHVSRIDLVGKDAIVLKDGKQVTEFRDGILPWACRTMSRWYSTSMMPAAPT
jgi:cobaltochelatase CobS